MIYAEAQPTPDSTSIASTGQLIAQAPHSMQRSLSIMQAFPSEMLNTA